MELKEFYDTTAQLLDVTHDYHDPPRFSTLPRYDGSIRNTYKSRYNGRQPGNGRFPGHGLIRVFSPTEIFVLLPRLSLTGQFHSYDAAIAAIREKRRSLGLVAITIQM